MNIGLQTYHLPDDLASLVAASLREWQAGNTVRRLWAHDATLWTSVDEDKWLGWLDIVPDQLNYAEAVQQFADEVRAENIHHVLLLGMGGSSLCPEVLSHSFVRQPGFPQFYVLDSTDPAQINTLLQRVDLTSALCIVASKSGSTLEPNILKQYFFARMQEAVGAREAGRRFVAITDPGSSMQQVAEHDGFRRIFFGVPTIGGRFSALSAFGMAPAALMGIDVRRFLSHAMTMVQACGPDVPAEENPGVILGTILGILARRGRDKVTLIISPGIQDLGAWLEQLLAESTGKNGKGLIPVDLEPLGQPEQYGRDRLFVYVRFTPTPDVGQEEAIAALERAGHPVVRVSVSDVYDLGQEFFRWEMATAVAGALLEINPFDQPDVEASKIETRRLTAVYEQTGTLPAETPLHVERGLSLFTDEKNATALQQVVGHQPSLIDYLKAHFDRLQPGDYCALLAFIAMNETHQELLQGIRPLLRDRKHVATCLGFGPRFLHSTGQAYKGGPNSGVFLQITCDDAVDLPVPGQRYTFGAVKAAQARGDFQVLIDRQRRALRVQLGKDVQGGLKTLQTAIREALA